jgi:hypothetical protein
MQQQRCKGRRSGSLCSERNGLAKWLSDETVGPLALSFFCGFWTQLQAGLGKRTGRPLLNPNSATSKNASA